MLSFILTDDKILDVSHSAESDISQTKCKIWTRQVDINFVE